MKFQLTVCVHTEMYSAEFYRFYCRIWRKEMLENSWNNKNNNNSDDNNNNK